MTAELCEGCTALARHPVTLEECAAGLRRAALAVPPGRRGSITHGPVRERLWQALKTWRSRR